MTGRPAWERMLRSLFCWLGLHRDQVLYEPPDLSSTGAYRKGVWCVWCGRELR